MDSDGISIPEDALSGTIRPYNAFNLLPPINNSLGNLAITDDSNHKVDGSTIRIRTIDTDVATNTTFVIGDSIDITVHFTKYAYVDTTGGMPRLAITVGTDDTRYAEYVGAAEDAVDAEVVFRYQVQASDLDDDGIEVPEDGLDLNGGTIQDDSGNNAEIGHSEQSLSTVRIDGVVPTITAVSITTIPGTEGAYDVGETIGVRVTFSEPITSTGTPRLALTIDATAHQLDAIACDPVANDALCFGYEVQMGDIDLNGISIAADALTLNGGTIQDVVGNDAALGLGAHAITDDANHMVGLAGIEVSTETLMVTEAAGAGNTATYQVNLRSAPMAVVTVTPMLPEGAAAITLGTDTMGNVLVFTTSDTGAGAWDAPQNVTVRGIADDANAINEVITITHAATSDDPIYTIAADQGPTVNVTTTDDDVPRLTITNPDSVEEDAGELMFTISVSAIYDNPITVRYATADGTAEAGQDYTAHAATDDPLTIAAGASTATIPITLAGDDNIDEGERETFTVTLSSPSSPARLATADGTPADTISATGTIEDDDDAPSSIAITASPAEVTEGGDAVTVTLTATLQGGTVFEQPRQLNLGLPGGSAGNPSDYTIAPQSPVIDILAGSGTGILEVTITPTATDNVYGADKTISFTPALDTPSSGTTTPEFVIHLREGDTMPSSMTLELDRQNVTESGDAQEIEVTATLGGSVTFAEAKTITLSVGEASDTAEEGTDYEEILSPTFTLAAQAVSESTTFNLEQTADNIDEPDEGISVSATLSGTSITAPAVTLTLEDNNAPPSTINLSFQPASLAEDAEPVALRVRAAYPSGSTLSSDDVRVQVTLAGATATPSEDFTTTLESHVLVISAGSTFAEATFSLTIADDEIAEIAETFTLTGTATGLSMVTINAATFTIQDNDQAGLAFTDADDEALDPADGFTVAEDGTTTYKVSLAKQPTAAVIINLSVSDTDRASVSPALLNFSPSGWNMPQSVVLSGLSDEDSSADTLTVTHAVDASVTAAGYADLDDTEVDLIVTDISNPGVLVSETEIALTEAAGDQNTATYTVMLATQPSGSVTVTPTSPDGDAVSVATANEDDKLTFTTSGTGAWDVGQAVTVAARTDSDLDDEEVIVMHEVEGGGYDEVTAPSVTVTVDDNDLPVAAVADAVGSEADEKIEFEVTLSPLPVNPVTVHYATSNAPPTSTEAAAVAGTGPDTDYTAATGSVIITAGRSTGTVTIAVANDSLVEPPETFRLTLTDMTEGATLADPATATGTIISDDVGWVLEQNGALVPATGIGVTEGGTAMYSVRLGSPPDGDVVIDIAGGDALMPDPPSLTFTAANWRAARGVELTAAHDNDALPSMVNLEHAVRVAATADATGYASLAERTLAVRIMDNDASERITVSPTALDIPSGGRAVYTVKPNHAPSANVVVTASLDGVSALGLWDGDSAESTLALTFTQEDWGTAQSVTVTSNAGTAEGGMARITHGAASGDAEYDGITAAAVNATVIAPEPTGLMIEVSHATVGENVGSQSVTVTATWVGGSFAVPKVVNIGVGRGTDAAVEGEDYDEVGALAITIDAGTASNTTSFNLVVDDDNIDEPNEALTVAGSVASPTLSGEVTITINDNDNPPTGFALTVNPTSVAENAGATDIVVTVSVTGGTTFAAPRTVRVSVENGSATAPDDFQEVADFEIIIQAAAASETDTFTLTPAEDSIDEGADADSYETLLVTATDTTPGSTLTASPATIAIEDNDDAPTGIALSLAAGGNPLANLPENAGETVVMVTATVQGGTTYNEAKTVAVTVSGLADGSGTNVVDFTLEPTGGTFNIPLAVGSSSATGTFTVTPASDTQVESTNTITVGATAPGVASIASVTFTLRDHLTAPTAVTLSMSASDMTVAEGSPKTITVTASFPSTGPTRATPSTVTVMVQPGTATIVAAENNGSDFSVDATSRVITIGAGAHRGEATFAVTAVDDNVHEGNEQFTIEGGTPVLTGDDSGDASLAGSPITVTITDGDNAPTGLTLAVTPTRVSEDAGATPVTVTASLGGGTTFADSRDVVISVGAGSAGTPADFAAVANFTIAIPPEATRHEGIFTLNPEDDDLDEPDETVAVGGSLSVGGGTPLNGSINVSIIDDDTRGITVTPTSLSVAEGAMRTYTVVLRSRPSGEVQITPTSADGNAVSVRTSQAQSDRLTFAPSDWNTAVSVTVSGVSDDDAMHETVLVSHAVTGGDYATVSAAAVTVTVDDAHVPEVRIDAPRVSESASVMRFTVSVMPASAHDVSLSYAIADGTATGGASGRRDYDNTMASGTLEITAGGAPAVIEVPLADDNEDEGANTEDTFETILVTLRGLATDLAGQPRRSDDAEFPGGAATLVGTGGIIDDDDAPTGIVLSLSAGGNPLTDLQEDAGATEVTVTAAVQGGTTYNGETIVNVTVSGLDDALGMDVVDFTTSLTGDTFDITIPAGSSSAISTFTLTPTSDTQAELPNTITVAATSARVASIDSATFTLSEPPMFPTTVTLSMSASDRSISEGSTKTITVTASFPTGGLARTTPSMVTVMVQAGSATIAAVEGNGSDFSVDAASRVITINADAHGGEATFAVTAADDDVHEGDEQFSIVGSDLVLTGEGADAASIAGSPIAVTITDGDNAPTGLTLAVTPTSVSEDAGATPVTVTASLGGGTTFADSRDVVISVGAGSAGTPADFAAVANFTIAIPPEATRHEGIFTLNPEDDNIDEPDETVAIGGSLSVDGSTTLPGSIDVRITDDDDAPTGITIGLTVGSNPLVSLLENAGDTVVTVAATVQGGTTYHEAKTVTVTVSGLADATGMDVVDFTTNLTGGMFDITIPAGGSGATGTFTLTPTSDTQVELPNTITVGASAPGVASIASVTFALRDHLTAPTAVRLSVSALDQTVAEGSPKTITVTASFPAGGATRATPSTVTVTVQPGTATIVAAENNGSDFSVDAASKTITINGGGHSGEATFAVAPVDDNVYEGDEQFTIVGSNLVLAGDDAGAAAVEEPPVTVTITDGDNAPTGLTLAVTPTSVLEDAGATPVTVTATLADTTFADSRDVVISVGAGSAGTPADFAAVANFTIAIPPETASHEGIFTLAPEGDDIDEPDETVAVSGSLSVDGDTTLTRRIDVRIADEDDAPTGIALGLTVGSNPLVSLLENAGDTVVTVAATVQGGTTYHEAKTVTVTVSGLADGSDVVDFTTNLTGGMFDITIPAGSSGATGTFTLTPTSGSVVELPNTITVGASAPGVASIASVTFTLRDHLTAPTAVTLSMSASDRSISEGSPKTITVTASFPTGGATRATPSTVMVAVQPGTATIVTVDGNGSDFSVDAASKTITINAGEHGGEATFAVTPVEDDVYEGDEQFTLVGSNLVLTGDDASAASVEVPPVTVTITDGDNAPTGLTLAVTPTSVSEDAGATPVTVTATLADTTFADSRDVVVSIGDGSAGVPADFAAVANFTIAIPAEAASHEDTFTLSPKNDNIDEPDETVAVSGSLSVDGDTTLTRRIDVRITDDDDAPTGIALDLTVGSNPLVSLLENAGDTVVTVAATVQGGTTYHEAKTVAVTVSGLADGSDVVDFTTSLTGGMFDIPIPAGSSGATGTFTLTPTSDSVVELPNTITVGASAPGVASIASVTFSLRDHMTAPTAITLSMSASDQTVAEDSPKTITVTASFPTGGATRATPSTVTVTVQPGTATIVAAENNGSDFSVDAASKTITINGGGHSGEATFAVTPVDDDVYEGDEQFTIVGSNLVLTGDDASAASVEAPPVTVTITDGDNAPTDLTLAVTPTSVPEDAGATPVTVTASLDGGTTFADSRDVVVSVGTGSAETPADFAAVANITIAIPPEAASHEGIFTLNPEDDAIDEPDETVAISGTLSVSGDKTLNGSIDVGITDDDERGVTVDLSRLSVAEGATQTYTVVLRSQPSDEVQITPTSSDGDAVSVRTSQARSDRLTFAPSDWRTAVTVTVSGVSDDDAIDETVSVSHTVTGGDYAAENIAAVTVAVDDAQVPELRIDAPRVSESAGVMRFTVSLTHASAHDVTLDYVIAPGTATGGASGRRDYDNMVAGGALSIAAGGGPAIIEIPLVDDNMDEGDDDAAAAETILVTLSKLATNLSGMSRRSDDAVFAGGAATLVGTGGIIDDDDAPTGVALSLTAGGNPLANLLENAAATVVTVAATVQGGTTYNEAKTVTVTVSGLVDAPSMDVVDFTLTPSGGTFDITIEAGGSSATGTFTLTPTSDTQVELPNTITVAATAPGVSSIGSATFTLSDHLAAPTHVTLSMSASDGRISEGGPKTITVTATFPAGGATRSTPSTVTVTVRPGTATIEAAAGNGSDFSVDAASKLITIAGGEHAGEATFAVTAVDDDVYEGGEQFTIEGGTPVLTGTDADDATLAGSPLTVTITDGDSAPTGLMLAVTPASVSEDAGATPVTVTASLIGATFADSRDVVVSVGAGSAETPADFAAVENITIAIPPEAAGHEGILTLAPVDDDIDEPDETVALTGTLSITGGAPLNGSIDVGIADGDDAPTGIVLSLSAAGSPLANLLENAGATVVTVTATVQGGTTYHEAKTVAVTVSGTDEASDMDVVDFTTNLADGTLDITIEAGGSSATGTFTLTPTEDTQVESPNTVMVGGTATGVASISPATFTLSDHLAAPTHVTLGMSASDRTVAEDGGAKTITVTASFPTGGATRSTPSTVTVTVLPGTATIEAAAGNGSDFSADAASKTITIAAGAHGGEATFTITPVDDDVHEGDERFAIEGAAPVLTGSDADDARLAGSPVTVTITDDDAAPTGLALAVTPANVAEDAGDVSVTVTASLEGGTTFAAPSTVVVSVHADSAETPADFAAVEDITIVIPPEAPSQEGTFTLTPVADGRDEPAETVAVAATLVVDAATSWNAEAPITIDNVDESPLRIDLSVDGAATVALAENAGVRELEVTAAFGAGTPVRATVTEVTLRIDEGSATGADYTATGATVLSIPPGQSSTAATITLTLTDDPIDEDDETLTISGASSAASSVGSIVVTITDDDTAGLVLVDAQGATLDASTTLGANEGDTTTYTATLATQPIAPVTLAIAPEDDAKATVAPTMFTFTAEDWSTARTVTVSALADADADDETVTLTHAMSSTGDSKYEALADTDVELSITDGGIPGLRIDPRALQIEEGDTATYALSLATVPMADVTIDLNQHPAGDEKVDVAPTSLTFTPENWNAPREVTLTARSDDDGRHDTVTLRHVASSEDAAYNAQPPADVTVTITDDDQVAITITPSPVTVTEDETVAYAVKLDTMPRDVVTIALAFTGDDPRATVAPSSLAFAPDEWDAPQSVTVSGLPDDDARDEQETVTHAATSNDPDYQNLEPLLLPITVRDNDGAILLSVNIVSTPSSGGDTYGIGEEIELEAVFSGPVLVRGTPRLEISMGASAKLADCKPTSDGTCTGQASDRLVFVYRVQAGDAAPDGISIPDNPLRLNPEQDDGIVNATAPDVPANILVGDDLQIGGLAEPAKVDGSLDFMLRAMAGKDLRITEDEETATLNGAGDTSGPQESLTYAWRQAAADEYQVTLANANQPQATFPVPNLSRDTELNFEFTVTNPRTEQTATDEVKVTILADNDAPTAHAGEDQEGVEEAVEVTLHGTGSDPEGGTLTFAWAQEANNQPKVTLSGANTATATFTTPVNVTDGTVLRFVLTVSDPDGASATSRVRVVMQAKNFGGVLGHALSRFGRTLGSSAVDTLGERFGAAAKRRSSGASANIDGTKLDFASIMPREATDAMPTNAPRSTDAERGAESITGPPTLPAIANRHFDERLHEHDRPGLMAFDRNPMQRGSFEINLGDGATTSPGQQAAGATGARGLDWSFWGRFDRRDFEAEPQDAITLDGSTNIFYAGVDAGIGNGRTTIGLALSNATADVGFNDDGLEGDMTFDMLSVYPYANSSASERLSLWGMLGLGSGEVQITSKKAHELATDIDMLMAALGLHGDLASANAIKLAIKGDALLLTTNADPIEGGRLDEVSTNIQRLRFGLETGLAWPIGTGASLNPSLDLMARLDGGDADEGFGIEASLGIDYASAIGLSIGARARSLLTHSADGIGESGVSLMVVFDPGREGGLAFTLSPVWGDPGSASEAVWRGDVTLPGGLSAPSGGAAVRPRHPRRINAELRYGLELRDWWVTPYGVLDAARDASRRQWGVRLAMRNLAPGTVSLDLFGESGDASSDALSGRRIRPGVQVTVLLFVR